MKKSILISALLLCIAPSVFGQEDELKTATERKIKNNNIINKEEAERIRKEEEQRENVKDIPHIKNDIKNEFLRWAKKGEFESSKEHFERIQNEGLAALYKITDKSFVRRTRKNMRVEIDLGTYNADEKIYPITIIISRSNEDYIYRQLIKTNVPFEKEEAITLKKAIKEGEDTKRLHYHFSEENPDNWFVQDGFLYPINVKYSLNYYMEEEDKTSKKIFNKGDYPLFSEYVFNTDDLGLSEYFPENYTFTLKSLKK